MGIQFTGEGVDIGVGVAECLAEGKHLCLQCCRVAQIYRQNFARGQQHVGGIAGRSPPFLLRSRRVEWLVAHQFDQGGIAWNLLLNRFNGAGLGFGMELGTAACQGIRMREMAGVLV